MGEGWMFPHFGKEVISLEAEQLMSRTGSIREVYLNQEPPFVSDAGGREGEEVARLEIVALYRVQMCWNQQLLVLGGGTFRAYA